MARKKSDFKNIAKGRIIPNGYSWLEGFPLSDDESGKLKELFIKIASGGSYTDTDLETIFKGISEDDRLKSIYEHALLERSLSSQKKSSLKRKEEKKEKTATLRKKITAKSINESFTDFRDYLKRVVPHADDGEQYSLNPPYRFETSLYFDLLYETSEDVIQLIIFDMSGSEIAGDLYHYSENQAGFNRFRFGLKQNLTLLRTGIFYLNPLPCDGGTSQVVIYCDPKVLLGKKKYLTLDIQLQKYLSQTLESTRIECSTSKKLLKYDETYSEDEREVKGLELAADVGSISLNTTGPDQSSEIIVNLFPEHFSCLSNEYDSFLSRTSVLAIRIQGNQTEFELELFTNPDVKRVEAKAFDRSGTLLANISYENFRYNYSQNYNRFAETIIWGEPLKPHHVSLLFYPIIPPNKNDDDY